MDLKSLTHSVSHIALNHDRCVPEEAREAYASYQPSFMELRVPFDFQGDLEALTDKDLGALLHEYVHYLQNLSTPWGLYSSMVDYEEMVNVYRTIQESDDVITIPVIPFSDEHFEHQKRLLKLGNGFIPFLENRSFVIDRSKKVTLKRKVEETDNHRTPIILCKVKLDDGTEREIALGACIIKESMAAMMQQLIDHAATHDKDDIPYNLVRILCEDQFKNIANDPVKMITACYCSLFSMSPGEVLINELDNANDNPDLSPKQLLDIFMANGVVTMNGKKYHIFEFYGKLRDMFISILEKTLMVKAPYIREALSRADVSKGYVPILSILFDEGISRERVYKLMNGIGFPWVWSGNGIVNAKISDNDSLGSIDVHLLVCHNAIYSFLHRPNKWSCCPLRPLCLKGDIEFNECLENKPWQGRTCVMSKMAEWLGLNNKTILFN